MSEAMPWWGWGEERGLLGPQAEELLVSELGLDGRRRPRLDLDEVKLADPQLARATRESLRRALGPSAVRDDHEARVYHAAGKSYADLVRSRRGEPEGAPDAVLYPTSHAAVATALVVCAREGIAVVPFGGGTSVVGGVAPLRGAHDSVVALDLRGLASVLGVDRRSLTARVEAGIRGPALEAALASQDLTLGHFPQSFEHVSIGGCAATRSAGQASSGYGRVEDMIIGLRLAAPAHELATRILPASAAGPDLREVVVGSEGTLGVITELALRVRPRPERRRYDGMFFETFAAGTEALRRAAQAHVAPDVARLSDEEETRLTLALAGDGGLKGRVGRAYVRARGYSGGCLAILGWEGDAGEVSARRARSLDTYQDCGGLALGGSPGRAWLAGRYSGPYLRDELLDRGVLAETLETAGSWTDLAGLREAVVRAIRSALADAGTPGLVMCHVSHVYETGASLYFTIIARQLEGRELSQWAAIKTVACEAILGAGGTITHHHAIGRDHAPWLEQEIGAGGVAMLRALKAELDPAAIMNPGKLLSLGLSA